MEIYNKMRVQAPPPRTYASHPIVRRSLWLEAGPWMSASVFPMTSCSTKPQSCSQSAEGESVTHGYPPLTSHLIYPKKKSHISSSLPWPPSLLRWAHTTAPSAAVVVSKTKLRAVSRSSMASSRLRPPGKGACSRRELMARIARREISRRSDSARRQRVRLHPPPGQSSGLLRKQHGTASNCAPWARARASAASVSPPHACKATTASTGSGTGARAGAGADPVAGAGAGAGGGLHRGLSTSGPRPAAAERSASRKRTLLSPRRVAAASP
jgi:hypothetical protein